MSMAKLIGNVLTNKGTTEVKAAVEGKVVDLSLPKELPEVQDDKVPEQSFWCVEEPFVVNHSIPNDLTKARNGKNPNEINPVKTAFNLFSSYEDACAYGQRLNKNLLIFEIKPSATVRPQIALVSKLG